MVLAVFDAEAVPLGEAQPRRSVGAGSVGDRDLAEQSGAALGPRHVHGVFEQQSADASASMAWRHVDLDLGDVPVLRQRELQQQGPDDGPALVCGDCPDPARRGLAPVAQPGSQAAEGVDEGIGAPGHGPLSEACIPGTQRGVVVGIDGVDGCGHEGSPGSTAMELPPPIPRRTARQQRVLPRPSIRHRITRQTVCRHSPHSLTGQINGRHK